MKRSIWAALGIVIVALAVPAAALATHSSRGRHGHDVKQGATGSSGAASVTSYSDGTLVLALAAGGSITGRVTDRTRFVCLGESWRRAGGPRRAQRANGRLARRRGAPGSGSTGATGASGSTGATGWSGSTGSSGRHGFGGTSGPTGGRGVSGPTGPHGQGGKSGGWGTGADGSTHTLPPPCDSSLLVADVTVSAATAVITTRGIVFDEIVLLPAVQ
jgi:hypothetical protein